MRHTFVGGLVAVAWAVLLALPGSAQELPAGMWTGSVTSPDGDFIEVEYEVALGEEGLEIAIIPPAGLATEDRFEFGDVALDDGVLTFSWSPGVWLDCALDLQEDGSYEGECVDEGGTSGILKMVPPEEGDPDGSAPTAGRRS